MDSPITVYGGRLDATGHLLAADAPGIALAQSPTTQFGSPAVVSVGTDYVVAWSGVDLVTNATVIEGARISATTGEVTATLPPITGSGLVPAIAYDGTHIAIASVGGATVHVSLFDATTLLPSASPFEVSGTGTDGQYEYGAPVLAYGGSNFLLAWNMSQASSTQIGALRFTADGAVVAGDDESLLFSKSSSAQVGVQIAAARGNYLVVWNDLRDDPKRRERLRPTRAQHRYRRAHRER